MGSHKDIDKAVGNLMRWADRPEWADARARVFAAHIETTSRFLGIPEAEWLQELSALGYSGMVFGIAFEDFASRDLEGGRNLIEDYLKRRGWHEGVFGRRYLQALRVSALSLYEVVAVTPGKHCDIRDLMRGGDPIRVYENQGTRHLVRWDHLAARVLEVNGTLGFSGGMLAFPADAAQVLLRVVSQTRQEVRRTLKRRKGPSSALPAEALDAVLLKEACPAFTQTWVVHTWERLHAPLPTIVNRDGEAMVLTETRFPVDEAQREAAFARLDAAPQWEREPDGPFVWAWFPEEGEVQASSRDAARNLCGMLEWKSKALLLVSNSRERAERGTQALSELLQGLVGTPLTTLRTPEQVMADAGDRRPEAASPLPALDPQVEADLVRETLDRHYRQCLREPIPALGGRTPRQCMRSQSGRLKIVAWLKDLENHEGRKAAQTGGIPYDFSWMWETLKVEDLR